MTQKNIRHSVITLLIVLFGAAFIDSSARADNAAGVSYQTVTIDGVDIFYREAGDPSRPTLLLLHGFPTSSHMFRDLITELADEFHLVAPDYPGYGFSSMPSVDEFDYSFDNVRHSPLPAREEASRQSAVFHDCSWAATPWSGIAYLQWRV